MASFSPRFLLNDLKESEDNDPARALNFVILYLLGERTHPILIMDTLEEGDKNLFVVMKEANA